MHRCECVVISLSYKCQCILICTYTVNEVNLNLFLVWPRGVNRRWVQEWCQQMDKLQKLKKSFICRFGWKDFPSYYKYIHSRAICISRGAEGPGREILQRPPSVCLSVRLSVCLSVCPSVRHV